MSNIFNSKRLRNLGFIAYVVLVGFQNCSPVRFSVDQTSLAKSPGTPGDPNGGDPGDGSNPHDPTGSNAQMTINDGDTYTNDVAVRLQLGGKNLAEMYITNNAGCNSGGEWEKFGATRSWVLEQMNQSSHVYAQFKTVEGVAVPCISATIIHDNISPTVEITDGPPDLVNNPVAHHEFRGDDAVSGIKIFECKTAMTNWTPCNSPNELNGLADGSAQFLVRATDHAGNISVPASDNWVVDLTAPTVHFTETPPSRSRNDSAIFHYEVEENGSGLDTTFCQFDTENVEGPTQRDCLSPAVFNNLGALGAEKKYRFTIWARDRAGNISRPASYAFSVYNVPLGDFQIIGVTGGSDSTIDDILGTVSHPTVHWTPSSNAVSYTVAISDETGAVRVCPEVSTPASSTSYSYAATACRLNDGGRYLAHVVSQDAIGGRRVAKPFLFTVDLSPPTIQITGPIQSNDDKDAEFDFIIKDPSGIEAATCIKSQTNGTQPPIQANCKDRTDILYTNLPPGEHTFQIIARDRAGNEGMSQVIKWQVNEVVCDPFARIEEKCVKGLKGNLWYLSEQQRRAPFDKVDRYINEGIKAKVTIYMSQLFVPTTPWTRGFKTTDGTLIKNNEGQTLFEYFAMRFDTIVKLDPLMDPEGRYQFAILSDDGSLVEIKDSPTTAYRGFIDNDGTRPTKLGCNLPGIDLKTTSRIPMRIKYYQGPRNHIALTLLWRRLPNSSTVLKEPLCNYETHNNHYFFGPIETQPPNLTGYAYGNLVGRGWKPLNAKNFIVDEAVLKMAAQ